FSSLLPAASIARAAEGASDLQLSMLPRYCLYTEAYRGRLGANPVEEAKYKALLGNMLIHLHHYCYGLLYTNEFTMGTGSTLEKLRGLRGSLAEFDYVLRSARATNPNFVLLPEIYWHKGKNMLRLGLVGGIFELEQSIKIKPDYWPPYADLSDYYKKTGE